MRVARRHGAVERADRRRRVQGAPSRQRVAAERARPAARGRRRVDRRPLDDRGHLLGTEQRPHAEQVRSGGGGLRRGERRAVGRTELVGRARRVALLLTAGARRGDRARERRQDVLAGSGDVVVDGVAVRESGRAAAPGERAHAEDVRERCRVAREAPRRARRLVGVPDCRDHDRAALHRVADRLLLEPRVGVAARPPGVAEAAEGDVDHARAVVDRPPDRLRLGLDRDRPARRDDLRDDELGRRREAGDARRVVELRGDDPRDDRPVAARVLGGAARRSSSRGRCAGRGPGA